MRFRSFHGVSGGFQCHFNKFQKISGRVSEALQVVSGGIRGNLQFSKTLQFREFQEITEDFQWASASLKGVSGKFVVFRRVADALHGGTDVIQGIKVYFQQVSGALQGDPGIFSRVNEGFKCVTRSPDEFQRVVAAISMSAKGFTGDFRCVTCCFGMFQMPFGGALEGYWGSKGFHGYSGPKNP